MTTKMGKTSDIYKTVTIYFVNVMIVSPSFICWIRISNT